MSDLSAFDPNTASATASANPYAVWGARVVNYPVPSLEPGTWLIGPTVLRSGRAPVYPQGPVQYPDQGVARVPTIHTGGTVAARPRSETGGTAIPRGQDVSGYYVAMVPPRIPTAGDPRSY